MRYSHLDLAPLFPALYSWGTGSPCVSASHLREGDLVTLKSQTMSSPVTMQFRADETPYRILSPQAQKRRKARTADDWEEHEAWEGTATMTVGGLATQKVYSWLAASADVMRRPKPVSDAAVLIDPFDLADGLAFVGRLAGGHEVLVTAGSIGVTVTREARLWSLAAPLPIGDAVLAVSPAAANWFAGAVRLFASREGHVAGRMENRGTGTVPLWRVRVDAPSGAFVALDLTPASPHMVASASRRVVSDCAKAARAFVHLRAPVWPERFIGSDLRDLVVDEDGLRLADPTKHGSPGKRLPVEAVSGDATTCVPVDAMRDALRATGPDVALLFGNPTDPVLVSSRDGRAHIAVLPWVPAALWPR
jgi:hypothetical protein